MIGEPAGTVMTGAERVRLLDAAMRSGDPMGHLVDAQIGFERAGREEAALIAAAMRVLIWGEEIEAPMLRRADWMSGPFAGPTAPPDLSSAP